MEDKICAGNDSNHRVLHAIRIVLKDDRIIWIGWHRTLPNSVSVFYDAIRWHNCPRAGNLSDQLRLADHIIDSLWSEDRIHNDGIRIAELLDFNLKVSHELVIGRTNIVNG